MTSFDIQLTRFERRLISFYRRAGTLGIIGLVTLVSVVGSFTVVMGVIYPLSGPLATDGYWYFLGGSIGVPLLIAPLASILFARLLVLLDQSFQVVESLSTTDPLTGSANRRGFFVLAERNIHARQGGNIFKVAMVDLNDFKAVNDTYGHQAGDKALVHLAQQLQSAIGDHGSLGRIGGDEFALLMIAEPSQMQSIENAIAHCCSQFAISVTEEKKVSLSASVGIAELAQTETFDDALARADAFLYANKRARREKKNSSVRERARQQKTNPAQDAPSQPTANWAPEQKPFTPLS